MKLMPTKKTLKRSAIGLCLLLGVLLLTNAFLAWRTEQRFAQLVRAVRAEGDPASIVELTPEPIPEDQNSSALIEEMALRLADFGKAQGDFYRTELGSELDDLQPGELPSDEHISAMLEILDRHAILQQQIKTALSAPGYASTADFSLGFNSFMEMQTRRLQQLRTIARFVDWRVSTLVAEEKQNEAIDWSLSLLKWSTLCKGEPTVVSYLVTVAIRNTALHGLYQAIRIGPTDGEMCIKIDHSLQQIEPDSHLENAFRTERALNISACIERGWKRVPPVVSSLLGWPIKRRVFGPIELYDEIIPLVDKPYIEIQGELQPGGILAVPTGKGVLADLLASSIEAALRAKNRDVAQIRALRVLNALRCADDDVQGLDGLTLVATATIDPFNGKQLVATNTAGGWIVYSVGENQRDDNGTFEGAKDLGFGSARGDGRASAR